MLTEINFDGIVGPTHNFAGLSLGNLAATGHAGEPAFPRMAALQGLAKMRANLALGLAQGVLLPPRRPDPMHLGRMGATPDTDPRLTAQAWSASAMWAANAATVSPAPDTADGRCHMTVANLVTMGHRAQEWPDTLAQFATAFADKRAFALHPPIPPSFGDEGAANHMRLADGHGAAGLELFVYGRAGGPFPARQHEQASRAVARLHGLDPERVLFVEQSPAAIAAGAFHNDVVAVANERVLFAHEQAFADRDGTLAAIRQRFPALELVEVPAKAVSLDDAIATYLFNSQLVTLPNGSMALVMPSECADSPAVSDWLDTMLATNGPIVRALPVDVRESMHNGGGPACLRLRVVADPATVDPRFLLDNARADAIERVIAAHWPERIDPADIGRESLADTVVSARHALLETLDLAALA